MRAQELMQELGKAINIPGLTLDKTNGCRLSFDEHSIDFEALDGTNKLYLVSNLGLAPAINKEACYSRLLEANRFGEQTGGASLSLDPETDTVILHKSLEVTDMDYLSFEQEVDQFLGWVKYWKINYDSEDANYQTVA